jgi:hypothetical protein
MADVEIGADQARELLAKERQARIESCVEEIQAVLKKYGCRLEPIVTLRAKQIFSQIRIVANE